LLPAHEKPIPIKKLHKQSTQSTIACENLHVRIALGNKDGNAPYEVTELSESTGG
tara:strand:+ start:442 stop:606 length:165 start_codon:yes stop_codon:yes gene_type:complete